MMICDYYLIGMCGDCLYPQVRRWSLLTRQICSIYKVNEIPGSPRGRFVPRKAARPGLVLGAVPEFCHHPKTWDNSIVWLLGARRQTLGSLELLQFLAIAPPWIQISQPKAPPILRQTPLWSLPQTGYANLASEQESIWEPAWWRCHQAN